MDSSNTQCRYCSGFRAHQVLFPEFECLMSPCRARGSLRRSLHPLPGSGRFLLRPIPDNNPVLVQFYLQFLLCPPSELVDEFDGQGDPVASPACNFCETSNISFFYVSASHSFIRFNYVIKYVINYVISKFNYCFRMLSYHV